MKTVVVYISKRLFESGIRKNIPAPMLFCSVKSLNEFLDEDTDRVSGCGVIAESGVAYCGNVTIGRYYEMQLPEE